MEAQKKKLLRIIVIAVACVAIIACSITIPLVSCSKKGNKPACEHEFLAATCFSPARCVKCNATTGQKLNHGFTIELPGAVQATCFTDGYAVKECPYCHEQRAEHTARLAHRYEEDESASSALTCEHDEITGYKCELCGDAYSEIVTRHQGHTPDNAHWTVVDEDVEYCTVTLVEATNCTKEGCDETVTRTTVYDHHATVSV